jgi:fermentation-respiration switch protein FrsA (DUF1100 family)
MTFAVTIFILIACWLLMSPPIARPLYDLILFHPFAYPEGAYNIEVIHGIKREDAWFSAKDGSKLHGWWFNNTAAPGGPVVLVSHGNGGNITHRAYLVKALIQSGASVFLYDYRGYGRSTGKPTLEGICEDGKSAYEYLTGPLAIDPSRVVLMGESLGSGVTCNLAEQVPCKAVILQSGYHSIRRAGMAKLKFLNMYPMWLFPKPELDNIAFVKKTHPPLLVVHGELDTLLPCAFSKEIFKESCGPKSLLLLPKAGHNDVPDQPEYVPGVTAFLSSLHNIVPASQETEAGRMPALPGL